MLKALIFAKVGLKLSYFCKKIANLRTLGLRPQTPLPLATGGVAPNPQWLPAAESALI